MAEEFQESEVIFSDHDNFDTNYFLFDEVDRETSRVHCNNRRNSSKKKQQKKKKKSCSASVPVNIPSNVFKLSDSDDFEEEYDVGERIVPPHVVIGRRIEGKMAFSVCTGNGRTLKGRDLSQVRNSILRLTGFLEA